MLNNIGLPGIILLLVVIGLGLLVMFIRRSSERKGREQARIAAALEEIAKARSDGSKT